MQSRRIFIGQVATGLAGTLAGAKVLGANERVRLGVIGVGARGTELLREALGCENAVCAGVADAYAKRLDDARGIAPTALAYKDYRALLDAPGIDAVLIATPLHLHAEHFLAALQAGKHVYLERTLALTLEQAKKMRKARQRAAKLTVQIGHQWTSSGQVADAAAFLTPELMGDITAIRAHMYRNTPRGKPQWARPVYPDMTPENVAWDAFLGDSPARPFEADRFVNWRFFQDYSGGNVTESMSQQLAFWYKLLNLSIPKAATMTGGVYLWKDGREVPDTMSVSLEQPEEILIGSDSGFGNDKPGVAEDVLGTDGAISRSQQIRYLPQKVNRPRGNEMLGQTRTEPRAHMRNFLECIRGGVETNCPFELGYRVAVACRMALESYSRQRTVRWDPIREEII